MRLVGPFLLSSRRWQVCEVSGVALWMAFGRRCLSEYSVMRSVGQLANVQPETFDLCDARVFSLLGGEALHLSLIQLSP